MHISNGDFNNSKVFVIVICLKIGNCSNPFIRPHWLPVISSNKLSMST
jgi:hypothetical protein